VTPVVDCHFLRLPMTYFRREAPASGFRSVAGRDEGLRRIVLAAGQLGAGEGGPMHLHHGEEILHILPGEVDVTVGSDTRRCSAGDIVIIPTDTTHGFTNDHENDDGGRGRTRRWPGLPSFGDRRHYPLGRGLPRRSAVEPASTTGLRMDIGRGIHRGPSTSHAAHGFPLTRSRMRQMMIFKGPSDCLYDISAPLSRLDAYRSCGKTFAPKISIQSSCLWPT
jgi:Cupin domain